MCVRVGDFPLAAFVHVWSDGAWEQPLAEIHAALECVAAPRWYNVVGGAKRWHDVAMSYPTRTIHVPGDWSRSEASTINWLREYAQRADGAVLYCHTKGAYDQSSMRARWRQSMIRRVIWPWTHNLNILSSGDVDAVGCHWLTPQVYPGMVSDEISGFFGGNFWMARCDYLRTLPECGTDDRFDAERWIGRGNPRVIDLLPGWPGDLRWPELC